jgi:predicted MPP superfamily phosphohydrolase
MTSFLLLSDIHLKDGEVFPIEILNTSCEYLVLSGDICRIESTKTLISFLELLSAKSSFKKIFYICGDHEFYTSTQTSYLDLFSILREETRHLDKLYILNNSTVDIGKDLRIYGGTMWSKLPSEFPSTEFLPIFDENRLIVNSNWIHKEHYKFLHSLDYQIQKAHADHKRLIVVTHHAPSFKNTKSEHSPQRFIYCSDLDQYLRKDRIHVWMFGHIHVNVDHLTAENCRVVTNQYSVPNFDPQKVIYI